MASHRAQQPPGLRAFETALRVPGVVLPLRNVPPLVGLARRAPPAERVSRRVPAWLACTSAWWRVHCRAEVSRLQLSGGGVRWKLVQGVRSICLTSVRIWTLTCLVAQYSRCWVL